MLLASCSFTINVNVTEKFAIYTCIQIHMYVRI